MSFDISKVIRPNILSLEPYRCARDDFAEGILLDANENAHGPNIKGLEDSGLNRYPDPNQVQIKELIANFRNKSSAFKTRNLQPLTCDNFCLGVGSDESIDALIRATCVPGHDRILLLPPTYGMYSVCAKINDVSCVECPLTYADNTFQIDIDSTLRTLNSDPRIKLVFITSPGNPTGAQIEVTRIEQILKNWKNGIVVVDEAYIDFAVRFGSVAPLVTEYQNLAVLQTFSKSFGLAGVRLGYIITSVSIARSLNAMKAPYNISKIAADYTLQSLQPQNLAIMQENVNSINKEKIRLLTSLTSLNYVDDGHIGGLDANFIMVRIKGGDNELAKKLYLRLAQKSKIVTRFRGNDLGCQGGIRITVGTRSENDQLIEQFTASLEELNE